MRELTELQILYQSLSNVFDRGPAVISPKVLGFQKFGFLVEITYLVSNLIKRYEKVEKKGECAVAEWGLDLEVLMEEASMAGVFLSRAGDQDGAHFCFALKNVYQFVLEDPDSKWDRFPTRREDRVKGP